MPLKDRSVDAEEDGHVTRNVHLDQIAWFRKGKDGKADLPIKRRLIEGEGKDRALFSANDLLRAEKGDVLFMGETGGMHGHEVLVESVVKNKDGSVTFNVFGAFSRDVPKHNEAARESMTFVPETVDGKTQWRVPAHNNYRLRAIGQVVQPSADSDKPQSSSTSSTPSTPSGGTSTPPPRVQNDNP